MVTAEEKSGRAAEDLSKLKVIVERTTDDR